MATTKRKTAKTAQAKTTARKAVKTPRAKAAARKPAKATQFASVGSEAVQRATGKSWEQWLVLLDKAGAKQMPHKAIATLLSEKYSVPGWWSQMVTVGYEQARGLRDLHQKVDGYSASVSRTLNVSLADLYAAWHDARTREKWLPGAPLDVRRSTEGKSMRITWTAGNSKVDVNFYDKGPGKSLVQIEHSKLADADAVTAQKAYWSEGLERLRARLET